MIQENPLNVSSLLISARSSSLLEQQDMDMTNPDRITKFYSVPSDKFKAEGEIIKYYGYTMGPIIAEGGFSSVFKAVNNRLKQDAACKVVDLVKKPSDSITSGVKVSNLKNEITIMNRLNNRYIINLYAHFVVNSKLFVFMKFADNGTLFDYVKERGALSETESRKLMAQLLVGTEHMHDSHIVHRDLKLENILLLKKHSGTHSMTLSISGFGLSRIVSHQGEKFEPSKMFCGTTTYMAPEIILRRPYSPYSADLYALGVLLYCTMNNAFPWDQTDLRIQLKTQLLGNWEWACNSSPSKEVDQFLRGIIEPDVSKRWPIKSVLAHQWIASDYHSAKLVKY